MSGRLEIERGLNLDVGIDLYPDDAHTAREDLDPWTYTVRLCGAEYSTTDSSPVVTKVSVAGGKQLQVHLDASQTAALAAVSGTGRVLRMDPNNPNNIGPACEPFDVDVVNLR